MSVELSKKHKAYAGVLGLGLAALAVDQFIPGPSQAQAAGTDYAVAADPSAIGGGGSGQAQSLSEPGSGSRASLAERLNNLSGVQSYDPAGVKEAFDPDRVQRALREARGIANNDTLLGVSSFSVTSIMSGSKPAAVINGKLCFIDDVVPDGGKTSVGYRLVEIGAKRVILDHNGHRLELLRPEDDVAKGETAGQSQTPSGNARVIKTGRPKIGGT